MGPKYYVNANSSGTIFTGFVIRRGNTWLWDNLIADLVIIEGRLFFQSWQGNNTTGSWTSYSCEVINKNWAVQHATVLYFEAWENTSKVCELLQLIACEVTRESMLAGLHTRGAAGWTILSAGNHATVLATEIYKFPNATNATVSSEKKLINLIQPGKQCNIVAEL